MSKYVLFVLVTCMALALVSPISAVAQLGCTDPDLVAIVFENEDINFTPPQFVPYDAQIRVLNPSEAGFQSYDFKLKIPGNNLFLGYTLPPNSINIGQGEDFIVGVGTCQPPVNGQFILMTIQLMNIDTNQGDFFLQPVDSPSIPGEMIYQTCSHILEVMDPISGDHLLPVARVNGTPLEYCAPLPPLDMVVEVVCQGEQDNWAATSTGATDGYDADYDLIDTNLVVTFPHPEWNNPAGDNYRQDVRESFDPTLEMKQWMFVNSISSTQSGGEMIDLDFLPSFSTPAPFSFKLRDNTTGLVTDLNSTGVYSYWVPEGSTQRNFDLMIGNDSSGPGEFYVDVNASVGNFTDLSNRAGTLLAATDGFDPALDTPEPGPPPASYITASYHHPDWLLGPRFTNDIRAVFDPLSDGKTWPLMVETDQSGLVMLSFDPSFTAADNYGLHLKDMQTGQIYDLFPGLSYVFPSNGPGVFHFQLTVGISQAPDLDPTSRDLDPGWSMIGMPLIPVPGTGTFDEVILDQTPGYSYLFEYVGAGGYGLLGGGDTSVTGQGYWIATDTGFNWTMSGDRALAGVEIPLVEGWNLVGNPLWFPGPFEGIHVLYGGMDYPWQDAIQQGLVSMGVLSFDNQTGDYFNAIDLRPWNGYWINALVNGASLWFDWPNFQVLPARLSGADKSGLPVSSYKWETELVLTDAGHQRKSIVLGINPEATEGFDPQFDMPQPPSSPSGGSRLAFTRPDWNLAAGAYFSRDVMPGDKGPLTWDAVISTSSPGKVVLSWNNTDWPVDKDFQIYLPEENRVVVMSMRNQSNVHLEVGHDPLPIVIRTPDMASGVEDLPGMKYGVGVHPNPFNPMTTIHFDLPRPAAAEIRIYSVRGELFSVLGGESYQAGRQEVIWYGRDRHGRNAPSGSYFARLYVDGQAVGSVTKMSLVR